MEKNHPVSELMSETIQRIREAVDANTVVGTPIVAGEITLIPVSRISLGFGTAGSEVGGKTPKALGENPFGGGGGAGRKAQTPSSGVGMMSYCQTIYGRSAQNLARFLEHFYEIDFVVIQSVDIPVSSGV